MRPLEFRLLNWLLRNSSVAKYNFASSGLSEPILSEMGINTTYLDFAQEKDEHQRLLEEEIGRMHAIDPENVVITNGASESIFIAYSTLCDHNEAVVPLPNYEPMFTVPRSIGMSVRHAFHPESFPEGAVIGFTDPNNPTGRYLGDEFMQKLIRTSRRNSGTVFLNATYGGFTFHPPASYSFDENQNLVVCSSLTKFYGLGRLRIGWLMAHKKTAQKMLAAKKLVSGHSSEYSMWIARQVLAKRTKFVKRARRIYYQNIARIKKFIEETEGISAVLPDAAPFCLVKYQEGPSSTDLCKEMLEQIGILVSPGDFFGAPRAFRLCFTSEHATLDRGLSELSDFLSRRLKHA